MSPKLRTWAQMLNKFSDVCCLTVPKDVFALEIQFLKPICNSNLILRKLLEGKGTLDLEFKNGQTPSLAGKNSVVDP